MTQADAADTTADADADADAPRYQAAIFRAPTGARLRWRAVRHDGRRLPPASLGIVLAQVRTLAASLGAAAATPSSSPAPRHEVTALRRADPQSKIISPRRATTTTRGRLIGAVDSTTGSATTQVSSQQPKFTTEAGQPLHQERQPPGHTWRCRTATPPGQQRWRARCGVRAPVAGAVQA